MTAGLEYEFRPYLASVTLSADSIFSCEGEAGERDASSLLPLDSTDAGVMRLSVQAGMSCSPLSLLQHHPGR